MASAACFVGAESDVSTDRAASASGFVGAMTHKVDLVGAVRTIF